MHRGPRSFPGLARCRDPLASVAAQHPRYDSASPGPGRPQTRNALFHFRILRTCSAHHSCRFAYRHVLAPISFLGRYRHTGKKDLASDVPGYIIICLSREGDIARLRGQTRSTYHVLPGLCWSLSPTTALHVDFDSGRPPTPCLCSKPRLHCVTHVQVSFLLIPASSLRRFLHIPSSFCFLPLLAALPPSRFPFRHERSSAAQALSTVHFIYDLALDFCLLQCRRFVVFTSSGSICPSPAQPTMRLILFVLPSDDDSRLSS
ncbi:hypothetical protein K438DRAFT_651057 [Mycena galopus ATCC 62051]|nr:hypothetical protein K438DRAFT_651057 [Mycena galopus ATCC 62051]